MGVGVQGAVISNQLLFCRCVFLLVRKPLSTTDIHISAFHAPTLYAAERSPLRFSKASQQLQFAQRITTSDCRRRRKFQAVFSS
jgi:hypothetical protein